MSLQDLAREAGIQVDWQDADGRPQTVGPDTLRQVLDALDLPCASDAQIAESRERLAGARPEAAPAGPPPRAFTLDRRAWGVGVQGYSLRGPGCPEFGDFGALAAFAAEAGGAGADALAISPVHALFAADAGRYSPYGPSSRLFLNGLYARARTPPARDAGDGELIDWPRAIPAKLGRLRRDHAALEDRAGLDAFIAAGGQDLRDHAVFEAIHGHVFPRLGSHGWQAWPAALHDPRSEAVAAFAREHASEVDFHLFLQWRADADLAAAQAAALKAGMAVGLIADIAVGMDGGGSHAWSRPGDLLKGLSIGAPPDAFQAEGQDWGLAAFSPMALRASNYDGFRATLRAAMRHSGGVRIDHVMGLRRLWLVPHGAGPTEGAYLTYPFEDLLRIVAEESQACRAVVVAEDLGTVPPGFRETLQERGIMGMRVLWFERTLDGGFIPPGQWTAAAAALTTTHDLPTVAGWWRGRDLDWAERLGRKADGPDKRAADRARLWSACGAQGPAPAPEAPRPAVDAAIALVASTPCELALIAAEDLLGLDEQPNLPGTMQEHPNWRRRLPPHPLSHPDAARRAGGLAAARPRSAPRPAP
jgi:4-alpha-glucanotransferase